MKINKIIILFILLMVITNIVILPKTYAISDIISSGDSFVSKGDAEPNPINSGALKETNSSIYKILLGIGIVVAVIVGAVLGIQFIFQSAEGKAKISEALIPYIVGCFVVFGAFGIWGIAINAGKSISASGGSPGVPPISEGNIETVECKTCGVQIGLDSGKVRALQNGQVTLTCGNGHTHKYP